MTEPEQPRNEQPEQLRNLTRVEAEELLRARRATGTRRTSWLRFLVPYILFAVAVVIFLLSRLFQGSPAPPQLPPAAATLTAVATAHADLDWTREPADTSSASSAHSTATALVRIRPASAPSTALHDISVCTGIDNRAVPTTQRTSYENFTVWSLP